MFSFQDQDNNNQNNQANLDEQDEFKIESDSSKIELEQLRSSFLRLNADFDNYKKRIAKEKTNWISNCQADILLDLLEIVDDFDRAFSTYQKDKNQETSKWIEGFELIHKSLYKLLDKYDVKEITDTAVFNPEIHEAITQIESKEHKSGNIILVERKGFLLEDRILRPARVIVAQ